MVLVRILGNTIAYLLPLRHYRAVTDAGTNESATGALSGPVATPLTDSVEPPGAIASNSTAASSPVPDAPV